MGSMVCVISLMASGNRTNRINAILKVVLEVAIVGICASVNWVYHQQQGEHWRGSILGLLEPNWNNLPSTFPIGAGEGNPGDGSCNAARAIPRRCGETLPYSAVSTFLCRSARCQGFWLSEPSFSSRARASQLFHWAYSCSRLSSEIWGSTRWETTKQARATSSVSRSAAKAARVADPQAVASVVAPRFMGRPRMSARR